MNDEQRKLVLPELDGLTTDARELVRKLEKLIAEHNLHLAGNDPAILASAHSANELWQNLKNASEAIRLQCVGDVQDYVTSWYKALHYDMSDPIVEVDEVNLLYRDLPDPIFESCTYDGDDHWSVIMKTLTHGRERVIVLSDGVDFTGVYSSEKI